MALSSELRSMLDKAVVTARDAAEDASRAALGILAVDVERTPDHFDDETRRLRVALRAEARQLGGFERLVEECAYEQWHRMLFARFLAENDLLIHPEHGVAVTLAECEEIAHARGGADLWLIATEFASAMLPGIFRSDDPVLQLTLAPEGHRRLEEILAGLPREVFTSEDGLGWVYQYWQSKEKKEVNASGRKIGGADLAPVTQLFTENYMVRFLLENTLGAWWAARHPESPLVKAWEYLRFDANGKPAAGNFPGWPERTAEVTVMDPCCGSGHFLLVAFEMLRNMRMEAEGLSAAEAGDAVLRDNLFGLELDPRCTQIAAFALALHAWKTGGYRELPLPNIACSGISAKGRLADWKKLALGDERLERSLERLHVLFADAEDLGSLLNPRDGTNELLTAEFEEFEPLLERALSRERRPDPSAAVLGHAAVGAARAASLLAGRYVLVTTNPPFLGFKKQGECLKRHLERDSASQADLATAFLARSFAYAAKGATVALVTPQNWLFLRSYEDLRRRLLRDVDWVSGTLLGSGAFGAISGAVVNVALFIANSPRTDRSRIVGIDVSSEPQPSAKAEALRHTPILYVEQAEQLANPDARFVLGGSSANVRLAQFAHCMRGIVSGDRERWVRCYWEVIPASRWRFQQGTVRAPIPYGGREHVIDWSTNGAGMLRPGTRNEAYGNRGVLISLMNLAPTVYTGELYDNNCAPLVPFDASHLPALYAFASSEEFAAEVRRLDKKMNVTNATLVKVPFDLERWRRVARERFPDGLPAPSSSDPTQWLFTGRPDGSESPLQVAVARLLGYRWPRQKGSNFAGCTALAPDGIEQFADEDGIVCLPAMRGERQAAERLRALLAAAFGEEWSPAREADLLAGAGYSGKSLERWLRDGFFEQHCQLFHQRPFVWHIWDGRKDGFAALVNYHCLDRASLERLTYTYLGEWIRHQREAAVAGTPGADLRLNAAQELQKKLKLILEGEPPYDIFVRWKPLEDQSLGWEPDLSDGVRLNIRPFVIAGVLRKNPNVKWGKDRGKDPESAPWYAAFKGDRINEHPLTLAEKRTARDAAKRRAAAS